MKKISSVFNICFTVFLFLFALEPILGSYTPYWYAMYALIAVGIVVLLTTVTNGFRKKIFPLKQFTKIDATSYILPFISVLGIFISLEYDTSFLGFQKMVGVFFSSKYLPYLSQVGRWDN